MDALGIILLCLGLLALASIIYFLAYWYCNSTQKGLSDTYQPLSTDNNTAAGTPYSDVTQVISDATALDEPDSKSKLIAEEGVYDSNTIERGRYPKVIVGSAIAASLVSGKDENQNNEGSASPNPGIYPIIIDMDEKTAPRSSSTPKELIYESAEDVKMYPNVDVIDETQPETGKPKESVLLRSISYADDDDVPAEAITLTQMQPKKKASDSASISSEEMEDVKPEVLMDGPNTTEEHLSDSDKEMDAMTPSVSAAPMAPEETFDSDNESENKNNGNIVVAAEPEVVDLLIQPNDSKPIKETSRDNLDDTTPEKYESVPEDNVIVAAPIMSDSVPENRVEDDAPEKSESVPEHKVEDEAPETSESVPEHKVENEASEKSESVPEHKGEDEASVKSESVLEHKVEDETPEKSESVPERKVEDEAPEKSESVTDHKREDEAPEESESIPEHKGEDEAPEKSENVPKSKDVLVVLPPIEKKDSRSSSSSSSESESEAEKEESKEPLIVHLVEATEPVVENKDESSSEDEFKPMKEMLTPIPESFSEPDSSPEAPVKIRKSVLEKYENGVHFTEVRIITESGDGKIIKEETMVQYEPEMRKKHPDEGYGTIETCLDPDKSYEEIMDENGPNRKDSSSSDEEGKTTLDIPSKDNRHSIISDGAEANREVAECHVENNFIEKKVETSV